MTGVSDSSQGNSGNVAGAGEARASITTNEQWHPEMGWSPAPIVTDERFDWVVSDMGREGVTWLRVHVGGSETWINLANVVTIGRVFDHAG